MFAGSDVICIGPVPWDGIWARPQQLMSRLAQRGHRVIYVNPPVTWLSPLKDPSLWKKKVFAGRGLEPVGEGIWVLHPEVQWPFGNMKRRLNRWNQRSMARQLRRAIGEAGFSAPYLWTYLPGSADLAGLLPWAGVIYDCVDEHASFTGLIDPATVYGMEEDLMGQALITFASAEELMKRRQKAGRVIERAPNGAEVEHFLPVLTDPTLPVASEVADLPGPIVGFYGGIGDWIDLELVAQGAKAYPEYQFVLIGPMERDPAPVQGLANVRLLGPKPYSGLPGYVKKFDLCLMPFKVNDLTLNVNPVKMYEHLAAGKAVLSTDLPEVRPFADVVKVAKSPEEFVAAIGPMVEAEKARQAQGLAWETDPVVSRRVAKARENSWDGRLQTMLAKIAAQEKFTSPDQPW